MSTIGVVGPPRTLDEDEMSVMETAPVPTILRRDADKRLMLVTGRANPELAARIADKLGVELSDATTKTFANTEVYCRFQESVRGADVFIVQPTCANEAAGLSANDALMELLTMVDAAVGGSAHRVIAVTPVVRLLAPGQEVRAARADQRRGWWPGCSRSAGIDRILTMDLHSGQIQGFFQKPCDHMTALFMLTQYFSDLGLEDLVVVAPDAGRVKLNKQFAAKIGADLAILNKERPAQQVAEISYIIGDVRDKTALLVDDMIGTAGTLAAAAQAVRDAGARRIYAAATHGNFSGNAWQNLADGGLRAGGGDRHHPAAAGRAEQHPRALLRRPADQLDPPDLHRRIGQRRVRRREPAVLAAGHRSDLSRTHPKDHCGPSRRSGRQPPDPVRARRPAAGAARAHRGRAVRGRSAWIR